MADHLYVFGDGDVWTQRKVDHTLASRNASGVRTLAALTPAVDINGDKLYGMSQCRLYSQDRTAK